MFVCYPLGFLSGPSACLCPLALIANTRSYYTVLPINVLHRSLAYAVTAHSHGSSATTCNGLVGYHIRMTPRHDATITIARLYVTRPGRHRYWLRLRSVGRRRWLHSSVQALLIPRLCAGVVTSRQIVAYRADVELPHRSLAPVVAVSRDGRRPGSVPASFNSILSTAVCRHNSFSFT